MDTTLAVIGAGPYGLSVAAHARAWGVPHVLLGDPMAFWRSSMPEPMLVRSLGRSTSLSHPAGRFDLPAYLARTSRGWEEGQPYPKSLFLEYVDDFQRQTGVTAYDRWVTRVSLDRRGFLVECGGESLLARHVVVATGLTHFRYVPGLITGSLPASRYSHSSHLRGVEGLAGRRVAVIGGGQSAYEYALLAARAGVQVTVARRGTALTITGVSNPYSRRFMTYLCRSSPLFFRLPRVLRGPLRRRMLPTTVAPWVVSEIAANPVTELSGAEPLSFAEEGPEVVVRFWDGRALAADHVVAATGYRVDLRRLGFLDECLRDSVAVRDGSPVLDRHYQSSVPGLFFAGAMAMGSYGPAHAFVCGSHVQCRAMVDGHLGPLEGRTAATAVSLPLTPGQIIGESLNV